MRTSALPALLALAALATGCGEGTETPTDALRATVDVTFSRADPTSGHTHLAGANEVPARETRAQGQLELRLAPDGSSISYRLMATNIDDVFMAHLHLAPAGSNGPIVAWLYPAAPPPQPIPGRHTGILAQGEITTLFGPLEGQGIDALWEQIEAGQVYGNVHTSQYPGGEVRGQVRTGG
jgi:CHRD domain